MSPTTTGGSPISALTQQDGQRAAAEAGDGDQCPERQTDGGTQDRGGDAHLQRQDDDLGQIGVEGGDQPERFGDGGGEVLHRASRRIASLRRILRGRGPGVKAENGFVRPETDVRLRDRRARRLAHRGAEVKS